jgi:hypothetical protein
MVGVARRGHGVEELIEAGNPANILGGARREPSTKRG